MVQLVQSYLVSTKSRTWLRAMGTMPSAGRRPTVGLSPTTPQTAAGMVMEPSVSVPRAARVSPSATAAADPELDLQRTV